MQQVFVFIQLNSFRERKDLKLGWPRGPLYSAEFAKGGSLGGRGPPAGSPLRLSPHLQHTSYPVPSQELSRRPRLGRVHVTVGPQGESKPPRAHPALGSQPHFCCTR